MSSASGISTWTRLVLEIELRSYIMETLIFGIFALLFGLLTIYLRVFRNSKGLSKLEAMKDTYGEKLGLVIHIISYTVVPIVAGIVMIVKYLLAENLL